MAKTPAYLVEALDMITARKAPSPKAMGRVESLHIEHVRDLFTLV